MKPRGRPPKENPNDIYFSIRITQEMRDAIGVVAGDEERSIADTTRRLLRQALEGRGALPKKGTRRGR